MRSDPKVVSAEHIRSVFARYVQLVTAGDVDAIAQLYAVDATVEDPVGSPVHRGRDAIRAFYRASAGSVDLVLEGRVRVAGTRGRRQWWHGSEPIRRCTSKRSMS
jgi:ketosteroid isomerase-like protein